MNDPQKTDTEGLEPNDPDYWIRAFDKTPISIVVPPYIRFLQGQILLNKALSFLQEAKTTSLSGHIGMRPLYDALDTSEQSRYAQLNYETFFASTLLIRLVSEVEHFLGSAVRAALRLYPGKMGSHSFKLSEILSATSPDELVDRAAHAALQSILYAKPLDYLSSLCEFLSIDSTKVSEHWPAYVEVKARRDVGVHNNWAADPVYIRKVSEAKLTISVRPGENVVPDFAYLSASIKTCNLMVDRLAAELGSKWVKVAAGSGREQSSKFSASAHGAA